MTDTTPRAAHFMLDLETLSLRSNAAVISIGVWRFHANDPEGLCRTIDRAFYAVLSSADQATRSIDQSTLEWWGAQTPEARKALDAYFANGVDRIRSYKGLLDLVQFFEAYKAEGFECVVWGNGAKFDNGILGSLFESFNIQPPWTYKGDACYRTVLGLFGHLIEKGQDASLVEHNALDDARYQSELLLRMLTPEQLDQMGVNLFTKKP